MASPTSIDPQTLAKLSGLRLRARHLVEGYLAGQHRSPYRGYSIEFAEHREYVPGDDLRYVDWKVFGRSDKIYLKQYEDETNLQACLALDVSESMTYRSGAAPLSKLDYAAALAAALAWLILRQQDAVGLALFDSQLRALVRPAGHPAQLDQIVQAIEAATPGAKTSAGAIFHELAERLQKRGVVVVLSDCFDDLASLAAGLKHFRHRRHDVSLLHVLDPAELEFPFAEPLEFAGLEALGALTADPTAVRRAYQAEIHAFCQSLERLCRTAGIGYTRVRTDQPLDLALARALRRS